jgi:hypothetical protein
VKEKWSRRCNVRAPWFSETSPNQKGKIIFENLLENYSLLGYDVYKFLTHSLLGGA